MRGTHTLFTVVVGALLLVVATTLCHAAATNQTTHREWGSSFQSIELAGGDRKWIASRALSNGEAASHLLWRVPVSASRCLTALTLHHVLRACGSSLTRAAWDKHRWIFTRYITGYDMEESTGFSSEDTVEYHDALTTIQLYAVVDWARNHRTLCTGGAAARDAESWKLCEIAASVERSLAQSDVRLPTVRVLRHRALRSTNVTAGPGTVYDDARFGLDQMRWSKSLLVPPVVEYFANLSRVRTTAVIDVLKALQAYTGLFARPVDEELAAAIYEAVVVPESSPAIQPHGRLWCPVHAGLTIDCATPNVKIAVVAPNASVFVADDRDGGAVEVQVGDESRLEGDLLVAVSAPGSVIRQGDPIRVCVAGGAEFATATFGLFMGGFGYDDLSGVDAAAAAKQRRQRFGSARVNAAISDVEGGSDSPAATRRRSMYFDVHMEMTPSPVAVEQGCLSQPLSVFGADSRLPQLLMNCMVIQQMPHNEQPLFRTVVDGADLQKKYDYLDFFDTWLHDIIQHNYSMPFVKTRPREDIVAEDQLLIVQPPVVPEWCTPATGAHPLDEVEASVCLFLRRTAALIDDARAVLNNARRRVQAGMAYLEKEMKRGMPELVQLQQETERRMLPVERILNHEGWSCTASWCGGGAFGLQNTPSP